IVGIREASARLALAVDEQLREAPAAALGFRHLGHPSLPLARFPAGDLPTAADDRLLAGIGRVDYAVFRSARIFRAEHQRLLPGVDAAADEHRHVPVQLS